MAAKKEGGPRAGRYQPLRTTDLLAIGGPTMAGGRTLQLYAEHPKFGTAAAALAGESRQGSPANRDPEWSRQLHRRECGFFLIREQPHSLFFLVDNTLAS